MTVVHGVLGVVSTPEQQQSEDASPEAPPAPGPVPPLVKDDPYDADWRERLIVLGSVFGAITCALVLGLVYSHDATLELVGLVPASLFAAGKFLPLWGITGKSNFNPWELGLVIWVMDTCSVLITVYALELFYRFPRLKRSLGRIQTNAGLVLAAYPRMRRGAVIGVICFVLFPVAGTGAIAGAFLGILMGMRRSVLIAAVSFGGLLGGMMMAFLATNFADAVIRLRAMQKDPVIQYTLIAALVLLIAAGFWALNRAYKKAIANAELEAAGPGPR